MKNKNELNEMLVQLLNDPTRDENHYAPLKDVHSIQDLHRLFVRMDQEAAVANRKKLAQINTKKPQKPINPEIWLKTADVLSDYPISQRTLANYRKQKKLPYSMLGRDCIYLKNDVDAMMFDKYNGKKVETNPTGKAEEEQEH